MIRNPDIRFRSRFRQRRNQSAVLQLRRAPAAMRALLHILIDALPAIDDRSDEILSRLIEMTFLVESLADSIDDTAGE